MTRILFAVVAVSCLTAPLSAQALPLVDDVEWTLFKQDCRSLLEGIEKLSAEVPHDTVRGVNKILESRPEMPRVAARTIQKMLDAHCLVGVHINPESRVKAARGERRAVLVHNQPTYVIVKVHNQGAVTHPLTVTSEQAVIKGKKDAGRWLEVTVVNDKPFVKRLTGRHVEYRVLRLVAREKGKREATLAFDVGQGTQDLGFRAEVPILFVVREK